MLVSVATEWHLFNNVKKIVKMVKSYSLYDLILVWFAACRMNFCHFWWWQLWVFSFFGLGFFLTVLFEWNTVKRNGPVLLSLLVLVADRPSLLCLPSAWAERADCKPACAWELPNCVQAVPAWASNPWTWRFACSLAWFYSLDTLMIQSFSLQTRITLPSKCPSSPSCREL